MVRWRDAMAAALYGQDGFFVRADNRPADHFRTSTHASPLFATAILRLIDQVDVALGHPDRLVLVDLGAGRGELLTALMSQASTTLTRRLHPVAVELAPRPEDLPTTIRWARSWSAGASLAAVIDQDLPDQAAAVVVVACEWLDNIPVDIAELDPDGIVRYRLVDPATGREAFGDPVTGPDWEWLRRWWPLATPGTRAEIGRPRDEAWGQVIEGMTRGLALAIDYGHLAQHRPLLGTLTGFRYGREVAPVPDGSCDLTAHVAMDSLPAPLTRSWAPRAPHGTHADDDRDNSGGMLVTQREALRSLGVDGTRPPLELAHRDPTAYLRRLVTASQATELTDPAGLGGHRWLLQPVALPHPLPAFMAR